jgi:hypothetical protein
MNHKHQFLSYALHRMQHPHLVFKLTRHRSCIVNIVNALIPTLSKNIAFNLSNQLYFYQHHGQQKTHTQLSIISFPSLNPQMNVARRFIGCHHGANDKNNNCKKRKTVYLGFSLSYLYAANLNPFPILHNKLQNIINKCCDTNNVMCV